MTPDRGSTSAGRLPRSGQVEPMLAKQIEALPARPSDRRLLFEPKWDGFRAIVAVTDGVEIYSRRGTVLTRGFPEVAAAVRAHLPAGSLVDGELVCWREGRLDFGGVQRRNSIGRELAAELAASEPCHLIVFDVLRTAAEVLIDRPLTERRLELERLFTDVPAASPLALCMQTDDLATAKEWFESLALLGVEGIVIKPAGSRYIPGNRGLWEKVKHFQSTEMIVGGIIGTLQRPQELLLGRYVSDTGEFTVIGRTVPLHAAAAKAVGAALQPAGADHPWPDRLPGGWNTAKETEYVKVDPRTVVEVRVDVAAQAGRWRHGLRFLRVREDVQPEDVPTDMDTT